MLPDPDTLPELLTRPLADNAELRLFVQADLEQRLANSTPGPRDDTAEQALVTLRNSPSHGKKSRSWLAIISVGLAALWLVLAICEIPGWLTQIDYDLYERIGTQTLLDRLVARQRAEMLTPHPFFSPLWKTSSERLEGSLAFFIRNPGSAEAYYNYALNYWIDRRELPVDFDATWKRLDPNNAIWPLLKMSLLTGQSTEQGYPAATITNPALFAEAVASMKDALNLPLNTFRPTREHLTRISFRHPRNWAEAKFIDTRARIGGYPFLTPRNTLIQLELGRLKAQRDQQALADFLSIARRSVFRAARAEYGRSISVYFSQRCQVLEKEADRTGLVDERDKFRSLASLDKRLWNPGDSVAAEPAAKSVTRALTRDHHSPLQWAEVIYRSRQVVLMAAAGLIVILIVLWLRGLPYRGAAHQCALCIAELFTWRNSGGAVLLSATLPTLWFIGCLAFTQLTSFNSWPFIQVSTGAIIVMVLAALAQGARVSIARRAGIVGFRSSRLGSISWITAVLLAFLSPAMLAAFSRDPGDSGALTACAVPGAIALLWLAGAGLLGFFIRGQGVRQRLIARRMIPAVLVFLAGLAVCDIAMIGAERHVLSGDVDQLGADPASLSQQMKDQAAFDQLEKEWQSGEGGR